MEEKLSLSLWVGLIGSRGKALEESVCWSKAEKRHAEKVGNGHAGAGGRIVGLRLGFPQAKLLKQVSKDY